jgi:hypothetical protein
MRRDASASDRHSLAAAGNPPNLPTITQNPPVGITISSAPIYRRFVATNALKRR